MDEEELLMHIQTLFGNLQNSTSLVEDPVDVEVQMKYFDACNKWRKNTPDKAALLAAKDHLTNPNVTLNSKRKLLVLMAGLPDPEMYRILEAYDKEADPALKDWAHIAAHECKTLLEGELLDKPQILISSGLGGKGNKLRFFGVLFHNDGGELQAFQQKLLREELGDALLRHDGELERIEFKKDFTTLRVILPIFGDFATAFREAINECNQYGNFVSPRFMLTNLKELSDAELRKALRQARAEIEAGEMEGLQLIDDDFPPIE